MDRIISSSDVSLAFKSERRKFFNYIVQWFYKDLTTIEDSVKVDISDIIIILQILGFKLQQFERNDKFDKPSNLKIELSCGSSNMHALLSLSNVVCNCPTFEDENKGQFWEISGVCPSSNENLSKISGSSLLPTISRGTTSVIRDVISYVLAMLKIPNDLNENNDSILNVSNNVKMPTGRSSTGSCIYYSLNAQKPKSCDNLTLTTSFKSLNVSKTSYDNFFPSSPRRESVPTISSTTPAKLLRQTTWDIDSKDVSPLPASSPILQSCTSNNNVLCDNGKESLSNILIEIKNSANKAIEIITMQKSSPVFSKPYTPVKASSKQLYIKKISTPPTRTLSSPLQNKSLIAKSSKKSLIPVKNETLNRTNSAEKRKHNQIILSNEKNRSTYVRKNTMERKPTLTDEKLSIRRIGTPRPTSIESKNILDRSTVVGRRRMSIDSKSSNRSSLENINSAKLSKESKLSFKKIESHFSKISSSINVPLFKQSKS